jgi:cytochrome b
MYGRMQATLSAHVISSYVMLTRDLHSNAVHFLVCAALLCMGYSSDNGMSHARIILHFTLVTYVFCMFTYILIIIIILT